MADSQLIFKAEESRLLSRKLEAEQEASLILRSEVNGLRDRLTALASQANDSIDMARKESEVLHSIKIETLNLEIDRMRVRHEEALRAAEVLHRQKLSSELESHRAKVRALEDELASAVSSAAAASASLKVRFEPFPTFDISCWPHAPHADPMHPMLAPIFVTVF